MREHYVTKLQLATWRQASPVSVEVRRGPRWLRRRLTAAVCWLLRALDAWPTSYIEQQTADWIPRGDGRLLERALQGADDIRRLYEGGVMLCVGPDVFGGLERDLVDANPFEFQETYKLGYRGELFVGELRVHFLPWMRGALLVPDPTAEKRGRREHRYCDRASPRV